MSRTDVSHHVLQQEKLQYNHCAGQLRDVKHLAEQKNKDCVGEFHMGKWKRDTRVTLLFKAALSGDAAIILQCEMICIRRRTSRLNLFLPAQQCASGVWLKRWCPRIVGSVLQKHCLPEGHCSSEHPCIRFNGIWRAALNLALVTLNKISEK